MTSHFKMSATTKDFFPTSNIDYIVEIAVKQLCMRTIKNMLLLKVSQYYKFI